ncbi:hypothetical protein [Actinomycetospora sp.]|uniref:DUF2795 domain-containing protein n=1 Tax=Actinomycetospora sp. TaxID=1872135 RepID=UPI002F3FA1CA
MRAPLDERLSPVLDALDFPAARWEIITVAEEYGADLRTRTALRALTRQTYFSRGMLLREIAENGSPSPRPVAGPRAVPSAVVPRSA